MKKLSVIIAFITLAFSLNVKAQPQPQAEPYSKADKTTVEFVVRDSKPILMDI